MLLPALIAIRGLQLVRDGPPELPVLMPLPSPV